MHVCILDHFPRHTEDKLGLAADLGPVSVEKGDRLLGELLLADLVEELEGILVELLCKRCHPERDGNGRDVKW